MLSPLLELRLLATCSWKTNTTTTTTDRNENTDNYNDSNNNKQKPQQSTKQGIEKTRF
jgi:hypothetical protein